MQSDLAAAAAIVIAAQQDQHDYKQNPCAVHVAK
jgi:hypothetical protein